MYNRDTRKAGTYVKELCVATDSTLQRQKSQGDNFTLFNMSMNPGPSIQEYVEAECVCNVSEVSCSVPVIPYPVILGCAYTMKVIARPLGIQHPFNPVLIRKLAR